MTRTVVALLLSWVTLSHASCPELYPEHVIIKPAAISVVELCNSFYVTHYDVSLNKVVFVSERLQPGTAIGSQTRLSGFRADPRIKNSPVTSLYDNSGFDRGHLVPAEDAATLEQMRDTFLLTNVVPQNPHLNRGAWKKLENTIRTEAMRVSIPTHVVTIPIYSVPSVLVGNKIPVPAGLWKVTVRGGIEQYFFAGNGAGGVVAEHKNINWRAIIQTQGTLQRQ